jgi:hypothetical protein
MKQKKVAEEINLTSNEFIFGIKTRSIPFACAQGMGHDTPMLPSSTTWAKSFF